ncbi:DUF3986 family protein [Paenibacillus solisilvae]|uniref:DUF3986 family protein n=1 Tax=Paenibacillus solisilvae TaxID=2486751 RepID=A0ABW0VVW6_9BACL
MGHFHIGYYEDNYCIEATGFQNEDGGWDVFFNDLDEEDIRLLFDSSCEINNEFGVLLFKAADYEDAENKFVNWVKSVLLPFLEPTSNDSDCIDHQ